MTDPEDSGSRQARVGAALRRDTRDRLLEAAGEEFAAHGYAATTVTRLAAAAGVSVQTLYLAWGSKRGLLRGYMEGVLRGDADSPEGAAGGFDDLDPHERIGRLAALVADIAGRASLGWRLYRDAAGADPEIAADWNELQLLRRATFERILSALRPEDLRPGLTLAAAADTAWAIASPEAHELLVNRLGYDLDAFRAWMRSTLAAALLAPSTSSA